MAQVAPNHTLQQAYEKAKNFDGPKQEMLGQVLASATRGENLSPSEIERRFRDNQTLKALQDIEDGNVVSVEEARAQLAAHREERFKQK